MPLKHCLSLHKKREKEAPATFFHKNVHEYDSFADVQVDGQDVVGGTENSGAVGRPLELQVGITNTSGAPLPPLSLRITAFQDHQNGHLNYRLDAKMTTTGATKLTTPQVQQYRIYK